MNFDLDLDTVQMRLVVLVMDTTTPEQAKNIIDFQLLELISLKITEDVRDTILEMVESKKKDGK